MIFVATKIVGQTKFVPSPILVLLLDLGSGMDKIKIRDPGKTSQIRNTD
jgi:hypothetical protein